MSVESYRARIFRLVPALKKSGIALETPHRKSTHTELRRLKFILPVDRVNALAQGCLAACLEDKKLLILMDHYWDKVLTDDELQAVVAHELGHICLGHVQNPAKSDSESLKQEIEADSFSVLMGSKPAALMSALVKISLAGPRRIIKNNLLRDESVKWGGEARLACVNHKAAILAHPHTQARLKLLAKLC